MTNLGSILKSRDITLPTKVRLVKGMVILVLVYGCESWTIKKAECLRTDAFELWCWRRLLRVSWAPKSLQMVYCGHEIKRCLLLGRKDMTTLDSILKIRDITLPTKVRLVKGVVFPIVMHRCESWTVKKAEPQRTDAFELWCWRRLLRVPWTARRSSQSILKEISPGCSLEGLMLKLKLQCLATS